MISEHQYKKLTGYVVKCKSKTDDEIKENHLKRLEQLSLKSLGEIPQLDELTFEQEEWVKRRTKAPASSWRSFS